MNQFITIMKLESGLASYQVNEQALDYKAQLIKTTSSTILPQEVIINRKQIHHPERIMDILTSKLIHAIKSSERNF